MKKKRKNKGKQRNFIYYFIITSVIPIFAIMIVNFAVQDMVQDHVLQSGNKVLEQFFLHVDAYMENMLLDINELVEDEEIRTFARKNAENYRMYAYIPELLREKLLKFGKGEYADILVWYAYDDRIVSQNYSSRLLGDFYAYSHNIATDDYFYKYFDVDAFYKIVKSHDVIPVFDSLVSEDGTLYLTVTLAQGYTRNINRHYAVTILLEQKMLSEMTDGAVLAEGESIFLYNEDGECVLSSEIGDMKTLPEECRKSGNYEYQDEEGKYVLIVRESEAIRGYYAMKIPNQIFWDKANSVRLISWLGVLCSLVLGTIVAWRLGGRTQRTFEGVMKNIQTEKNIAEKKRKLEEKNKNRNTFLLRVLEKNKIDMCNAEVFEKNEIVFSTEQYMIGILGFDENWEWGREEVSFVISNVFEELMQMCEKSYVIMLSATQHMIIVNLKEGQTEQDVYDLFEQGISFLNEHLGLGGVLGCSSLKMDLIDICDAYREASKALKYHFLREEEMIIVFSAEMNEEIHYPFGEESCMYQMIDNFMRNESGCGVTAEDFTKRLLAKYDVRQNAPIELVERFRYELQQTLNQFMVVNKQASLVGDDYLLKLSAAKGFRRYCEVLQEGLSEISEEFQSVSVQEKYGESIRKYVEEHYMDCDMNVASIGERFNMQSAYLSKIFKTHCGMALPDYISKVRIKNSKSLLKDGKLTVGEIATRVGFMSSNIYINNFKRWEGITPGKYRELGGYHSRNNG